MATAAASLCGLEFFGGSIAYGDDLPFEANILACERVIEVHFYDLVGHFEHNTVDTVSVGGHHREDCTGFDHLVIKLAVNLEYIFLECGYLLRIVGTESFVGFDCHIERIVYSETVNCNLERTDHSACHAEYDAFWILGVGLMHEGFTFRCYGVEVITELYIFSGCDFFHVCIYVVIIFSMLCGPMIVAGI